MRFKCFVSSVFKAYELRRDFLVYKLEKHLARHHNEADDHGLNHCCSVLQCFRSRIDEDFYQKLQKEGSLENFIFKSVIGFLGGVILTYVCYIFLIFSLNFTLKRATYICVVLGVILPLGLAFSVRIRCTVFLCIPQLFSKRGRQALLAYAFILALSGPAKNTLHNVEVMSESLACGQEQLKQAEDDLLQCIEAPNAAVKKSLEKLLENLVFAVEEFKNLANQLYKLSYSVLETLLHAYRWLYGISVLCNEKMLTPADRCMKIVAESISTCKSVMSSSLQLSEEWSRICSSDSLWNVCNQLSGYGKICTDYDLPDFLPFEQLDKRLKIFQKRIKNIFAVKLEFKRSTVKFNKTSTADEEYEGVATEIRRKTDQFLQYFDVMSVIFGIFILVLFIKVIIYRYKFLTEDEYDNRFITSDFIDIDKTRAEFRMETLLPLELREKRKYIKVTSLRLVPSEKTQLFSSFIFLMFATFKIIIHMLTDSFLYWILSNLRRNGRRLLIISRREDSKVTVTVAGDNIIAALFRNVTKVFKPYNVHKHLDPVPCLPDPVFPDWNRYYQILALVLICWFLALFEPYGLRLRHIVMVTYHPDRARERAIWLYNRILATRTKFAKFARRRLRKKYRYNDFDSSRWTIYLKPNTRNCLLCKMNLDGVEKIKCPTPLCVGLYCRPCYSTIKFCSICLDPSDYGDLSDISEEKDSSDESCSHSLYHVGYFTTKRKPIVKSNRFVPIMTRAICFSELRDSSDEEGMHLVELKKEETIGSGGMEDMTGNLKSGKDLNEVEMKPSRKGQNEEKIVLTAMQNKTFLKATEFTFKSEKSTQTIKLTKIDKNRGAIPKMKTDRSKKSKEYFSNSETERKGTPCKPASVKRAKLRKTRSLKLKIKRIDRFPSTDSDTSPENFKNRPRSRKRFHLVTSKISRLFKRRPKTPENVTTDEENNPTSTVFLSDEEFQELSRRLSRKFEDKPPVKRKLSQLSYAPDLLSDLPSSKASELCWDSDNVSDSDQT